MYVPVSMPAIIFASSPKIFCGETINHENMIPIAVPIEPIKNVSIIGSPAFFMEFKLAFNNK